MVKKTVCVWILLLVCSAGMGQKSVEQLFGECAKLKGAEHVNIGKITIKLAGLFAETMGIESVNVLEFGNCDEETKERVRRSVGSFKDRAFDTVVNVSENGERTRVLVRIQDDMIRELVILTSDSSPAMVHIKGRIKASDVERLIKENKK
jgi:hypothetical protein